MKEALICFIVAIVIGSLYNSLQKLDVWGVPEAPNAPASAVQSVNEGQYEKEIVSSPTPVLAMFYDDNDPASARMAPVIAKAAKDLGSTFKIVRMDAGDCPIVSRKYDITAVPQFLVLKQGDKVDQMAGEPTKEELVSFAKLGAKKEASVTELLQAGKAESDEALQDSDSSESGGENAPK